MKKQREIKLETLTRDQLEKLDRLGIRCNTCEHWEKEVCYGYESDTWREKDAKICDIYEPNRFQEFYNY